MNNYRNEKSKDRIWITIILFGAITIALLAMCKSQKTVINHTFKFETK